MGQGLVIGEVVDADDLDIGAGVGYRTEETPSDPAESVDSDTNGHNVLLLARFAHGLVRAVFTGMLPVNATPARPAMLRGPSRAESVTGPAFPGSDWPRCPGPPVRRPVCPPWPAACGSGRRRRPWSAEDRTVGRVPPGRPACAPTATDRL